MKLSQIMDARYGESIKKLEKFMEMNINERVLIFFDEAEALFSKRGKVNEVFENDRLLTVMLKMMDRERKALIVMSTNLPKYIDSAILRRFDHIMNFDKVKVDVKRILLKWLDGLNIRYTETLLDKYTKNIEKINYLNFSDTEKIAKKIALLKLTNTSNAVINEMIIKTKDEINEERRNYE